MGLRHEVTEGKAPRSTSLGPSKGCYGNLRDEKILVYNWKRRHEDYLQVNALSWRQLVWSLLRVSCCLCLSSLSELAPTAAVLVTEDAMGGWHQQLNGRESEPTRETVKDREARSAQSMGSHRASHDWATQKHNSRVLSGCSLPLFLLSLISTEERPSASRTQR